MVKMMLQDNLQQLDDNPSNKSDHVPHLLSPYYSAGQQCIEEVQQQQQQQHQERNSKVHVVLLGKQNSTRISKCYYYLYSSLDIYFEGEIVKNRVILVILM